MGNVFTKGKRTGSIISATPSPLPRPVIENSRVKLIEETAQINSSSQTETVNIETENNSVNSTPPAAQPTPSSAPSETQSTPVPIISSLAATQTLISELKKLKSTETEEDGFTVTPVSDNIYKWHVKLFGWDVESQIKQDMILFESVTGKDHVLLEVIFPQDFPSSPPFMRVVYPRFHQYTGHITIGGSICVKDLTKSGWNTEFELRSFIIMVRNLLLEGGALIDMDNATSEYSEAEGREAFVRVAQSHGWIP